MLSTLVTGDTVDEVRGTMPEDGGSGPAAGDCLSTLVESLNGLLRRLESYSGIDVGHVQIADLIDEALREVLQVGLLVRAKAVGGVGLPKRRSTTGRLSSSGAFYLSHEKTKPLTGREEEVLRLINAGYTNKSGARLLSISPRTYESHRQEIMRKFGARNVVELVQLTLG